MDLSETPVADLKPYKQNARTHSPEQVRQIVKSIEQFGFTNPVLTDGKNRIVAGHGRVMAAKEMGLPTVPTIPLGHLTKAQVRAYVIADNKLALNAGWDEQILSEELKGIDDSEIDIDLTGFSEDEIAELLKEEPAGSSEQDDNVPDTPQNIFNVQRGQIWQLGRHRLMCGDSTDKGDVGRLMDGQKADMVFTDPPYELTSGGHKSQWMVLGDDYRNTGKLFEIPDPKDWMDKLPLASDADVYVMFNAKNVMYFLTCLKNAGIKLHNLLVMEKSNAVPNRWYLKNCEFCFYGWVGKAAAINDMTSVSCEKIESVQGDEKVHVSQKPVAYVGNKITNSSGKGDAVFDPFLGSGSTLIACEKTGRKCYGMEIDPHYCSVIINRWQEFTGKTGEPVDAG